MFPGQVATEVGRGNLIDVHRYQPQRRSLTSVLIVAFQYFAKDHVRMGIAAVLRYDCGHGQPFTPLGGLGTEQARSPGSGQQRAGLNAKCASGHHGHRLWSFRLGY